MEKDSQATDTPKKEDTTLAKDTNIAKRILKVIAYPVSAVLGFWAMRVSVHNSAYNMAKSLGAFDDILSTATPQSKSDVYDLVHDRINTKEYLKKSIESKASYQKAGLERMEKLGLKGFRNKWNYMSRAGKQDAIITGLTVSGIAIGALLTVANSKTISRFFSGNSKQDEKRAGTGAVTPCHCRPDKTGKQIKNKKP